MNKGVSNITPQEYVRLILEKRNMKQMDLIRKLNELQLGQNGKLMHRQHLNNVLNGKMKFRPKLARKIEIALGLEKYQLVRMVGMPRSQEGIEELERVGL